MNRGMKFFLLAVLVPLSMVVLTVVWIAFVLSTLTPFSWAAWAALIPLVLVPFILMDIASIFWKEFKRVQDPNAPRRRRSDKRMRKRY